MKNLRLKKGDILVLAALLLIAAAVFLCLHFAGENGAVAVVEVNGVQTAALPLAEDTVYDVILDGKVTNTVEIKDGAARVISADCPDKICVHHRAIHKTGESILCLPNKVVVTVESAAGEEVDGEVR